jgi:hypothetical protein
VGSSLLSQGLLAYVSDSQVLYMIGFGGLASHEKGQMYGGVVVWMHIRVSILVGALPIMYNMKAPCPGTNLASINA